MFDSTLITPLIYGVVIAIIVALYGYIVPPLFKRPRADMAVIDIVLLALLIAIIVFVFAQLGWVILH